ncbi:hypothetical protein D3C71_1453540 [compost metagenome]
MLNSNEELMLTWYKESKAETPSEFKHYLYNVLKPNFVDSLKKEKINVNNYIIYKHVDILVNEYHYVLPKSWFVAKEK